MKRVLLHTIKPEGVGGTRTVVNDIKNSYLKEKYEFIDLVQEEVCGGSIIKAISFVRKYKRIIDASKADAIYVCGLLYSGFLITLSAKLSSVKRIVVSVHGSELDKTNQNRIKQWIFGHFIEPLTVYMADDVFTVCEKELSNPVILSFAIEDYTIWVWLAVFVITIAVEAMTQDLVSIWFAIGSIAAMITSFFVDSQVIQIVDPDLIDEMKDDKKEE